MISWFSGKKQEKPDPSSSKKIQNIISLIINQLNILLSRELGQYVTMPEDIACNLKQQVNNVIKEQTTDATKLLENNLVHVKERYNQIVSSMQQTKLGIRQFHSNVGKSIEDFIIIVSQTLQSKELLVPIKDIKKGLSQSSSDTVDKYFNLLGKLYLHEYNRIKQSSSYVQNEMKMNKSLESEIVLLREQKKHIEKKVQEIQQQKNSIIKGLTQKQATLMNKLKSSDENLATTILELKQAKRKIEQLQTNSKLLAQQEQQDKISKQSKQQRYLQSIKKLNQQKIELEDRYAQLQIQIKRIKNQQSQIIARATQSITSDLQSTQNKKKMLEHQVQRLKKQLSDNQLHKSEFVEKNVVRGMLEVYMDEGKEWNIKNQVEKQLVLLLNMKQKQQDAKEEQKKGWFGWI